MVKFAAAGFLILAIAVAGSTPGFAQTKEEKDKQAKVEKERQEIRKKSQEILGRLYKVQPSAKAAIGKSAGYAVFSNFGMKILVAGGGSGKGLAIDTQTKKETFMKMVEIQAGLGFGVKKFNLVWVFEKPDSLNTFINSGWELGGQTTAGGAVKGEGVSLQGALAVSPGVWLYQLTETGLALELTAKGTKYYKDSDLN